MAETTTQDDHEQYDRLSNLPDDILVLILNKLDLLQDAVRTTVLSKRWRHLSGFRSEIVLDVLNFNTTDYDDSKYTIDEMVRTNASVVQATKTILQQNCQHIIELLSITFYLRDESVGIVRSVDETMANKKILKAEFTILPEVLVDAVDCTDDDMLACGTRFMTLFDAYPRAFGGLTDLSLYSLRLGESDIPNVLSTCKKLVYLNLENCDAGFGSILQIEHSQLVELIMDLCAFGSVELKWLPNLTYLTCKNWLPSEDQYPLSLGHVPQLSMLNLSNGSTRAQHKTIELSELLGNAIIGKLDLDFQCERIWIQPERPKHVALQNLRVVTLCSIREEYGLMWTLFILEAAPLLNELNMEVSYHLCYSDEEDEYNYNDESTREMYQKAAHLLKWETRHDFKHCNMRNLGIVGFQIEEKFTRYIRRVMQAAVNLERVSLLESRPCLRCECLPSTVHGLNRREI
ncbi:unnamed protein product [Urochloa decumbens]|uniref:F-box domain-containing protein n=1 Tax=Urochloa decumbens TaxID=240449 RepID=A0ABC9DPI6_9POAL